MCDVVPDFVHSCDYVFFRDHARAVGVELIENSLELIIVQKGFDVESCDQEFGVVDFAISEIVDFADDLFDLFVRNVDV